jgi:hypothetical protein
MSEKWIPVFKTGTHTNSEGKESTWTEADLDLIVSKYDPSYHEAPAVIGHPENDSPAWGWVEKLKREGQLLYAKFKDLVPEFMEMVNKGMYKKRSISLYPDWTLKHVGFLGAALPGVKGLPNVKFKDGDQKTIEFSFECKQCNHCGRDTEHRIPTNGNNFCQKEGKRMKLWEWIMLKAKGEGVTIDDAQSFSEPSRGAVPAPSQADIQAQVSAEVAKQVKAKELEFAEKLNAEKQNLATQKADLDKEKAALEKAKSEKVKADIQSFCEGLCKEGKLTPAMMKFGMGMQNFMEKIATIQETIEFSEGNEKKTQTPFEYMKGFLGSFKKQIEFGEFAPNEKDVKTGNAAEKLHALTKKKMEDNKKLGYSQAFSEVQSENPDLAREYAAEIGK